MLHWSEDIFSLLLIYFCLCADPASSAGKRPRLEAIPAANLDADDPIDDDDVCVWSIRLSWIAA